MGTDISMYAEVRSEERWFLAEALERNRMRKEGFTELGSEWMPIEIYNERNYELFAILADVCNPIRSLTKFEIIGEPRGLPSDISSELLSWHEDFRDTVFAESWLLLAELEAFD